MAIDHEESDLEALGGNWLAWITAWLTLRSEGWRTERISVSDMGPDVPLEHAGMV